MEQKAIRRFPRTLEGRAAAEKRDRLAKRKSFMGVDISDGRMPRGYDKINKRQKKLVKLIINGMKVKDACRKLGVNSNTYYRWWNLNQTFRNYYAAYAKKVSTHVTDRLDAKLGRAVSIVETSVDSEDPYFAYDAAKDLLNGRGLYKKNVIGKQVHTGTVGVAGTMEHKHEVLDKEMVSLFVNAITQIARGGKHVEDPKIINAKVLKKLPPPKVIDELPEVQKGDEAATS